MFTRLFNWLFRNRFRASKPFVKDGYLVRQTMPNETYGDSHLHRIGSVYEDGTIWVWDKPSAFNNKRGRWENLG